jgi:hypothetical protein
LITFVYISQFFIYAEFARYLKICKQYYIPGCGAVRYGTTFQ